MANDEHVALLKKGVTVWNAWREGNPDIRPDLSDANLSHADLSQADLGDVNLSDANLSKAELLGALQSRDSGRRSTRGISEGYGVCEHHTF
jgi:hypothetical protein